MWLVTCISTPVASAQQAGWVAEEDTEEKKGGRVSVNNNKLIIKRRTNIKDSNCGKDWTRDKLDTVRVNRAWDVIVGDGKCGMNDDIGKRARGSRNIYLLLSRDVITFVQ